MNLLMTSFVFVSPGWGAVRADIRCADPAEVLWAAGEDWEAEERWWRTGAANESRKSRFEWCGSGRWRQSAHQRLASERWLFPHVFGHCLKETGCAFKPRREKAVLLRHKIALGLLHTVANCSNGKARGIYPVSSWFDCTVAWTGVHQGKGNESSFRERERMF